MLRIQFSTVCAQTFVPVIMPPCISMESWKQAHQCYVKGHSSGKQTESREWQRGQGTEKRDTVLSVSDVLDNER